MSPQKLGASGARLAHQSLPQLAERLSAQQRPNRGGGGPPRPASAPPSLGGWGQAPWRRGPLPCPPLPRLPHVPGSPLRSGWWARRAPASWLPAVPRSAPWGLGAVPARALGLVSVRRAGGCCSTMLRHRGRAPRESCRGRCEPLHSGGEGRGRGRCGAGSPCPQCAGAALGSRPQAEPPGETGPSRASPRGHHAATLRTRRPVSPRSEASSSGTWQPSSHPPQPNTSPGCERVNRPRCNQPTVDTHRGIRLGCRPHACLEWGF